MPKVSVIIPTYNREQYLSDAIDSVIEQTFSDYEIIVVDDGSTDNTKEVLRKYNGKIRYFFQKNNGPSAARNMGLKQALGEYVAFLDSDDIWFTDYLEENINLLEKCYDLAMTDNYVDIYTENKKLLRRNYKDRENYLGNESKLYEILFQRFQNGFSGGIGIVIKKSCFSEIGLFDENLKILEDWDLWLRIALKRLKIGYIQHPLFIYRRHPITLCRDKKNIKLKLYNIYSAFKKNKKQALKVNRNLVKNYAETLWMIGVESLINNIDLLFGIKCLLESQLHHFKIANISKIKNFKKYLELFLQNRS